MKVQWTAVYANMQYIKFVGTQRIPRNIHVSLQRFEDGMALAKHIDLHAKNHINESNFTEGKSYYGTLAETIEVAESWVK
jgi:hypothetical protein